MKTQNSIRFLFVGDIVARPGRRAVEVILPKLKKQKKIDVVIANAENLAGGKGATQETLMEMVNSGVDYFTSGHHIFHQKDWEEVLADKSLGIVRPVNYYPKLAGFGFLEFKVKKQPVILINLEGSEMMPKPVENPFVVIDRFLDEHEKNKDKIVLIDFHAEVTSEKKAFGYYVDGRVNAVVGTHTHVPTADLQILPKGTFYVTDLGMVGAKNSVLGVKSEIIIRRFIEPVSEAFEWEYQGEKVFNSVWVEIDSKGQIVDFAREDRVIP